MVSPTARGPVERPGSGSCDPHTDVAAISSFHRRHKREVGPLAQLGDRGEREIEAAERAARVAGDEGRRVQAALAVALALLDEEPSHRVHASEEHSRARRPEAVSEIVSPGAGVDARQVTIHPVRSRLDFPPLAGPGWRPCSSRIPHALKRGRRRGARVLEITPRPTSSFRLGLVRSLEASWRPSQMTSSNESALQAEARGWVPM